MSLSLSTTVEKRAKKRKGGTLSTKNHRFEPFSQRIARLKIDPVHRVKANSFTELDVLAKSHFQAALEHCGDLNASTLFTEFVRKVSPLCENLPQLLHHADQINDLLLEFVGKADVISAEPLLILLAQFARDLGASFEKYFLHAVGLVASIASRHEAPEVIEWSFTCLAWIFKFLSRLLVPDLRPLLSVMLPYLGTTRQKWFVSRFAAESMVYLLRKAATQYQKSPTPLQNAISFFFEALRQAGTPRESQASRMAFMTLLSEAIRGVAGGIHSSGIATFSCLLQCATDASISGLEGVIVVKGTLIGILHQTTAEGAATLTNLITDYALQVHSGQNETLLEHMAVETLLVLSATRKGNRIHDWKSFNTAVSSLLRNSASTFSEQETLLPRVMLLTAQSFTYSPLDELLPCLSLMLNVMLEEPLSRHFPYFCRVLADLAVERFREFVPPTLQKFVLLHWKRDGVKLLLMLLQLSETQVIYLASGKAGGIDIPTEWINTVVASIPYPNDDQRGIAVLFAQLQLLGQLNLPLLTRERISSTLLSRLRRASSSPPRSDTARLMISLMFKQYIEMSTALSSSDAIPWESIYKSVHGTCASKQFLEGLCRLFSSREIGQANSNEQIGDLISMVTDNLLQNSTQVKAVSLRLLKEILAKESNSALQALDLAFEIQQTPYSLQTVRRMSMMVRKIQALQAAIPASSPIYRAIAFFLLGLLAENFPPLNNDICASIRVICEAKAGESIVMPVLLDWLKVAGNGDEAYSDTNDKPNKSVESKVPLSDFECSNVENVEKCARKCATDLHDPDLSIARRFEAERTTDAPRKLELRTASLKALNAISNVAEKWSKSVVPIFLSVFREKSSIPASNGRDIVTSSNSQDVGDTNWPLHHRKDFIILFSKFVNPKVLYLSSDVYETLMGIIASGSSDLQQLGLKAIYCWRPQAIRPYQDMLLSLTDERKYREELAKVFHADNETAFIQPEHRSQLLPLMLRVLYGQAINRPGSRSNHADQSTKRKTILRALSRLQNGEVYQFIPIALGPLNSLPPAKDLRHSRLSEQDIIAQDHQHGLLNMILSMLEIWQGQLNEHIEPILNAVMYCLIRTCDASLPHPKTESDSIDATNSPPRRNRRLALRCLVSIFDNMPEIEWGQYVPVIFSELISPRLQTLPIETAQGVSSLLELFATWASSPRYFAFLVEYESSLLNTLADCLVVPSARDDVLVFVLDRIFARIARAVTTAEDLVTSRTDGKMTQTGENILEPRVEYILVQVGHLLDVRGGGHVLESVVNTIASLTPIAKTKGTGISILSSIAKLLSKPLDKIGLHTRSQLLQSMQTLLSLHSSAIDQELQRTIFSITAAALGRFKASNDRTILCQILKLIASTQTAAKVASLCDDLNAISKKKLDEIDHDRRLAAFFEIQESIDELRNPEFWLPIMHNLLYFALHAEDFAIRSHTVASIKLYVKVSCGSDDPRDQDIRRKVLLPGLKRGLKESSESVRADHVGMLGYLISTSANLPELSDMEGLLAHNDEEASFFNNILHIQHHRRVRALRRLTATVESGNIRSSNISSIFLPLVEKFVLDTETTDKDHNNNSNLVGPSVETIGTLTAWTEWGRFRQIFLRYNSYLKSKPDLEKNVIKLLSVCADSLHQAISATSRSGILAEEGGAENDARPKSRLSTTLPSTDKIGGELMENVIPALTSYVHNKDESEISLRVPLCIAVTKLLVALDTAQEANVLPPLLLDIAYILRSRSQDSRDTARKTLSQIVTILGRRCLPFVLKELRTALTRGYQLHVLSYTVHSILVSTDELFHPGDIDSCLPSLVAVVMDDIFGVAGQEKEAEEYTRKPKEVKSSKSYDSMELIARSISLERLIQLIQPLQSLLLGRLTVRQAHQIDELLRRISAGLTRNSQSGSKDMLVLVFQMMQKFYSDTARQREPQATSSEDVESHFLVQLSRPAKNETVAQNVVPTKLMRFGLDLLRSVLLKHEGLCTPENLHGFIPIIGDALLQPYEEVKVSAIRLFSVIVKLPLPGLDNDAQIFISEAVKVIKDAIGTNNEAFQAALKLITSYLRDRRHITIRDSDLAYLLKRIIPDIEEPDRQGVIFNFVKALMARQIVMPEVYELMDKIAAMMVTNHTRNARDVARGAFVYFLVEYPQSRGRWSKQLKFLVKNLDYKYPEGRQSVMEAVNVILSRSKGDVSKDIVDALFIPIVLMVVNDESSECRSMAGALLSQFFGKAEADHVDSLVAPIQSWLERTDNQSLAVAGLQVYEILLDTPEASHAASISFVRSCIKRKLKAYDIHDAEATWEAIYHALQLFNKLVSADPQSVMTPASKLEWSIVAELSRHQHSWVKSAAANLIGTWFHDLAKANSATGLGAIPLAGTYGLQLDEKAMLDIMKSNLYILKTSPASKELNSQCIRNLVFLGRCFNSNSVSMPGKANDTRESEDDSADEIEDEDDDDENSSTSTDPAAVDSSSTTPRPSTPRPSTPLLAVHYLLHQLAFILRREPSSSSSTPHHHLLLTSKSSALQLLFALIHHTPAPLLTPVLPTLLLPLAHLTDPTITPSTSTSTPSNPTATIDLTTPSHETLSLLQTKLGPTTYIAAMSETQRRIKQRREGRKRKRAIERVSGDQELVGRKRVRKNERKKVRRRERGAERGGRRRGW